MRVLFVAVALLAGACAPQPREEAPVPTPATDHLAPPTPDDVSVHITAAQAGQTVEVGVNQRFAVELVGVPTAGYVWTPAQVPDFITRAGEAGGNTIPAQNQPGYVGGNHWEVVMFVATGPGTGELILEQRRPWETNEAPVATFSVTIVAR